MLTRRQPVASAAAERLVVADAAAQLDLDVERADDLGQQLAVVAAAEGGVEVDQVDPLRAGLLPAQRRLERVAEALLGAGDALDQLDGLAVGDVDGGQELEVGHRAHPIDGEVQRLATQLRSSAAPASPDFSGWNWVADSGPFSTAATNRSPPCSAQVTSGARVRSLVTQRPVAHGVGVHEVEPLALDAGEQHACPRGPRRCSSPCAARRAPAAARRRPGHSSQPCGLDAVLDAALEEHLHADADAEHRAAAGEPAADHLVAADRAQPGHAGGEGADAGDDQTVGVHRRRRGRR